MHALTLLQMATIAQWNFLTAGTFIFSLQHNDVNNNWCLADNPGEALYAWRHQRHENIYGTQAQKRSWQEAGALQLSQSRALGRVF